MGFPSGCAFIFELKSVFRSGREVIESPKIDVRMFLVFPLWFMLPLLVYLYFESFVMFQGRGISIRLRVHIFVEFGVLGQAERSSQVKKESPKIDVRISLV